MALLNKEQIVWNYKEKVGLWVFNLLFYSILSFLFGKWSNNFLTLDTKLNIFSNILYIY